MIRLVVIPLTSLRVLDLAPAILVNAYSTAIRTSSADMAKYYYQDCITVYVKCGTLLAVKVYDLNIYTAFLVIIIHTLH